LGDKAEKGAGGSEELGPSYTPHLKGIINKGKKRRRKEKKKTWRRKKTGGRGRGCDNSSGRTATEGRKDKGLGQRKEGAAFERAKKKKNSH